MLMWIIILIIPAIFILGIIYYYNKLHILENRIDNAFSQIDVQLKKRADLIPNLVKIVKGYMKHEKSIMEMIVKSREKLLSAKTIKEKAEADEKISSALKTIFALAENYPNLKASENFKVLQEELAGVEGKIAYARQFYNDSVLEFNNIITTFPGKLFAMILNKKNKKEYFKAKETERKNIEINF